jgi:hypothetical protein
LRTSFKVVVAVAAIVVGGALTACGPVRMGAAATIGDQRIATSHLDSVVADWQAEFTRNPDAGLLQQQLQQQGQQVPADPGSPVRSALYQLIEFQVWDEVARQKGISVTPGQIDEAVAANGGLRVINANLLAADLPTRYGRDFVRSALIMRAAAQQAGATLDPQAQVDPQQQQAALRQVQQTYLGAAKALNIEINPRYGSYDPMQAGLAPVVHTLSKTEPDTR